MSQYPWKDHSILPLCLSSYPHCSSPSPPSTLNHLLTLSNSLPSLHTHYSLPPPSLTPPKAYYPTTCLYTLLKRLLHILIFIIHLLKRLLHIFILIIHLTHFMSHTFSFYHSSCSSLSQHLHVYHSSCNPHTLFCPRPCQHKHRHILNRKVVLLLN